MSSAPTFELTDTPSPRAHAYNAELPRGLSSAAELLQALYDQLALPGYFGFNWNALSDCLRDLSWISQREVTLRHAEVPALPEAELQIYLEVLAQAVQSWSDADEHRLIVSFPASAEPLLERLLS